MVRGVWIPDTIRFMLATLSTTFSAARLFISTEDSAGAAFESIITTRPLLRRPRPNYGCHRYTQDNARDDEKIVGSVLELGYPGACTATVYRQGASRQQRESRALQLQCKHVEYGRYYFGGLLLLVEVLLQHTKLRSPRTR